MKTNPEQANLNENTCHEQPALANANDSSQPIEDKDLLDRFEALMYIASWRDRP
jgi:hypothetical protein